MKHQSFTITEGKIVATAMIMVADSVINGWSTFSGYMNHNSEWRKDVTNLKELVDTCILHAASELAIHTSVAEVTFNIREYQSMEGVDSMDICNAMDDRCDELLARYIETGSFLSK